MTEPEPAADQLVAAAQASHRNVLAWCVGIVLLSAVLRVDAAGRGYLPGLANHPLPATCPSRVLLHVDCPGCGLTRSFIATAHGQFARAYAFHRVGPLLFLLVLLQIPLRLYALRRHLLESQLPGRAIARGLPWVLLAALLLNWLAKVITGEAFHV
jgi:hypothetical protein